MADVKVVKADDKNDQNASENDETKSSESTTSQDVKTKENNANIDDLDELLDSALADFDKPSHTSDEQAGSSQDDKDKVLKKKKKEKKASQKRTQDDVFNEVFNEAELMNAAQEAMKALSSEDPEMYQQLQNFMSQTCGDSQSSGSDDKFAECLKETMKAMSENAHSLGTDDLGDDDLVKALNDLGLNVSDTDDANFDPMIETMMKNLLSKDVLYPSMQRINQVYPSWLAENQSKLSTEQHRTYTRQHRLIREICAEFESEQSTDGAEIKKRRFDKIYTLMQEMQDCGQPPPDIVKELAPGMTLDSNGVPRLAGMEELCTVM